VTNTRYDHFFLKNNLIEEILSIVNYFSSSLLQSCVLPILQGTPPPTSQWGFFWRFVFERAKFFPVQSYYLKNNKKRRRRKIFNDWGPYLRV